MDIDKNATVLQGVTVPIGDAKTLSVSDVLELENPESDVILADVKGDLKIVLKDQLEFNVPTRVFAFEYGLPDS